MPLPTAIPFIISMAFMHMTSSITIDLDCMSVTGTVSATDDDARSKTNCADPYIPLSCGVGVFSDLGSDGVFIEYYADDCIAQNSGGGNGVTSHARCCATNSTNSPLVCTTKVAGYNKTEVNVECAATEEVTGCGVYGPWKGILGVKHSGVNGCTAFSDNTKIKAIARCCVKELQNEMKDLTCGTVDASGGSNDATAICGTNQIITGCSGTSDTIIKEFLIKEAGGQLSCYVQGSNVIAQAHCCEIIDRPTIAPSAAPTSNPSVATNDPSKSLTEVPSSDPTEVPSSEPSKSLTEVPSSDPTEAPTIAPSAAPTNAPSAAPNNAPSAAPTNAPSAAPTNAPSAAPTNAPSAAPTNTPSAAPSGPSKSPTSDPSAVPTSAPTAAPTIAPSAGPTNAPSAAPNDPSKSPSSDPSKSPTAPPTIEPTSDPSSDPTTAPTNDPTIEPSSDPSTVPSSDPSKSPTVVPTGDPSKSPSAVPTSDPTEAPTKDPSKSPTAPPSSDPSAAPTSEPTTEPSSKPSAVPSSDPTEAPIKDPSKFPTTPPTSNPSAAPSSDPSAPPTSAPSAAPTDDPTAAPICQLMFYVEESLVDTYEGDDSGSISLPVGASWEISGGDSCYVAFKYINSAGGIGSTGWINSAFQSKDESIPYQYTFFYLTTSQSARSVNDVLPEMKAIDVSANMHGFDIATFFYIGFSMVFGFLSTILCMWMFDKRYPIKDDSNYNQ